MRRDRLVQPRPAVAPLAAEHVTREALVVDPDHRRDLRIRRHRRRPLAQAEDAMIPAVGEPVEGVDPRSAESVSEPQRQHDLGTDRRRGQVRRALVQSRWKRSESA